MGLSTSCALGNYRKWSADMYSAPRQGVGPPTLRHCSGEVMRVAPFSWKARRAMRRCHCALRRNRRAPLMAASLPATIRSATVAE